MFKKNVIIIVDVPHYFTAYEINITVEKYCFVSIDRLVCYKFTYSIYYIISRVVIFRWRKVKEKVMTL